jgi:hypothetical protein
MGPDHDDAGYANNSGALWLENEAALILISMKCGGFKVVGCVAMALIFSLSFIYLSIYLGDRVVF